MEKENEVIENLFDEEVTDVESSITEDVIESNTVTEEAAEVENNVFGDLPPVEPVSYDMQEENEVESSTTEGVIESNDVTEEAVEVVNNVFGDLPPVEPFSYDIQEENEAESSPTEDVIESNTVTEEPVNENVNTENINREVLENPNAKIKLNTEQDEVIDKKELEELKNTKLMDNGSLRFVLIIGLVLLAVIFLIPYISEYI